MKQFLVSGWLIVASALSAPAADPIFINDTPITSPPDDVPAIDATAWLNRSTFDVTTSSGGGLPLPFEAQNNLFFTNTVGGVLRGNPGFRFFHNVGGQRLWMNTWTNNGTISTDSSFSFLNGFSGLFSSAFVSFSGFNSESSVLLVKSTNIASTGTGTLRSGAQGIIHLEGKNINLKRNGLRTGGAPEISSIFSGGFLLSSNYVNDFGIKDAWWGSGTNNTLNGQGPGMPVNNVFGFPRFTLPAPFSPDHEVLRPFGGIPFNFLGLLPRRFNVSNYTAIVLTNQTGLTNFMVQVVFYPTNFADPSLTTEAQFVSGFGFNGGGFGINGAAIPVVAFHGTDFDIVDQVSTVSSVYLSDALATTTNVYLARNLVGFTRRPQTFEVSRIAPFGFGLFGSTGNATYDPSLLWKPSFQWSVVTNLYAAYDAEVASVTAASGTTGDPTNFPGRIQIIGEEVDLDRTRIRAESAFNLKVSKNLTRNLLARIDAPWLNYDVTSVAPQLIISNIAPPTVRRFIGDIAAWSGTWRNYETNLLTTNEIVFHVLIVDPALTNQVPVIVNAFAAHATNVIIDDVLTIGQSFLVEGQGLHIRGGVVMAPNGSWAATNLQKIVNFTNDGNITVSRIANLGADRLSPYNNYVNRGTNTAATHFIRTLNFEDRGAIIASGGLLQVDTRTASIMGVPPNVFTNITTNTSDFFSNGVFVAFTLVATNIITDTLGARLQGNSDVQIFANDLTVSNSFLQAGIVQQGSLILSVTNRLVDSGPSAINHWKGTGGFQMLTRPAASDLIGTYLSSVATAYNQESFHTWCAQDLGVTVNGYSNNLGLGKLTLDGSTNSLFHFSPPLGQTGKALYVDYLELLNFNTNYNLSLDISPDFTIYFANANLDPQKLDVSNGGRLRWVRDFTGPLSSTNITYPSGRTYTFNLALAQSRDLDSDGDGIVNADDPTPFPEPNSVGLSIVMSKTAPHTVLLSWHAKAHSTSLLEYVSSPAGTNWQVLTNIINGPAPALLSAQDPSPASTKRFYRVNVNP